LRFCYDQFCQHGRKAFGQENVEYLRSHAGSVKYTIYPSTHEITANNQQDLVAWFRQELLSIKDKD